MVMFHVNEQLNFINYSLYARGFRHSYQLVASSIWHRMSEAAESLDRDCGGGRDRHVSEGIEDRDAGAEEGGCLRGREVRRDGDEGYGVEGAVFGVWGWG